MAENHAVWIPSSDDIVCECSKCGAVYSIDAMYEFWFCPRCGFQMGEQKEQKIDAVNHPEHYSGKVECIDAIESATADLKGIEAFCTGNAIKYLWRWKRKNGVEDIDKAIWYLERMRKELNNEQT